ncbi:unnamed protein product [Nesidiocoris tenuis]|uniref:VASt domain-containing protein n=1 Tax=Nesidiocoris tenuis TaxID=355587 RepID=A0A6H5H1Q9_9HEMI|nr:unnamed protein product [Nesidiocoris tenuis]
MKMEARSQALSPVAPSSGIQSSTLMGKTASPNVSPQPSPQLATKSQHRREPSVSSVKEKDSTTPDRSDGLNSQKVSLEPSPSRGALSRSNSQEPVAKDKKKVDRAKKKTPWYNAFNPTYKSRNEDFKRIFKDIPPEERLVVDYACAIQRDILVQGRLYVSQNYLSFYANIFRWETLVVLKWKEVTALTKEKTALVIPNAILVHTNSDKHFFTSFVARDKTYLMLFRVWQNALLDQPMSMQEMWHWVHYLYGEELGLTSDDDDYVAPATDDERNQLNNNNNTNKKELPLSDVVENMTNESEKYQKSSNQLSDKPANSSSSRDKEPLTPGTPGTLPTDLSDSSPSESESEKNEAIAGGIIKCPVEHEGRLMLHMQAAIHVDQLFALLFTESKFLVDLHETRKSSDIKQSPWTLNASTNQKGRTVSMTVNLGASIGPKQALVTESQQMLPCSSPGEIYAIEVEANNSGVPYSDTFYITTHYCLTRGADPNTCSIAVYSQIKYRKSVWGLVKNYIEKHCWQGLEEYFSSLVKALEAECERTRRTMATGLPCTKRKTVCRRRTTSRSTPAPLDPLEEQPLIQPIVLPTQTLPNVQAGACADTLAWIVFLTLFLLLVLNAALYYKLWGLEQNERKMFDPMADLDFSSLKSAPRTPDEWRTLLQKQEQLHAFEVERWLRILKASVHLLQQVQIDLNNFLVPGRTVAIKPTGAILTISCSSSDFALVIRAAIWNFRN